MSSKGNTESKSASQERRASGKNDEAFRKLKDQVYTEKIQSGDTFAVLKKKPSLSGVFDQSAPVNEIAEGDEEEEDSDEDDDEDDEEEDPDPEPNEPEEAEKVEEIPSHFHSLKDTKFTNRIQSGDTFAGRRRSNRALNTIYTSTISEDVEEGDEAMDSSSSSDADVDSTTEYTTKVNAQKRTGKVKSRHRSSLGSALDQQTSSLREPVIESRLETDEGEISDDEHETTDGVEHHRTTSAEFLDSLVGSYSRSLIETAIVEAAAEVDVREEASTQHNGHEYDADIVTPGAYASLQGDAEDAEDLGSDTEDVDDELMNAFPHRHLYSTLFTAVNQMGRSGALTQPQKHALKDQIIKGSRQALRAALQYMIDADAAQLQLSLQGLVAASPANEAGRLFAAIDSSDSGFVTCAQIEEALTILGDHIDPSISEPLFNYCSDKSPHKSLNFAAFADICSQ